ncbi:MAG: nitroreductase [Proteobacteria bacterium]|nr:nitroreductase [Pseudomonadota bacterium]MBU1740588.1 nitroreductase [Pseudomonadota bacterium]
MDLDRAMTQRRSVRAYLPRPVERAVLEQIIAQARWAPSWGNTQSWEFYVISGETVGRITADLQAAVAAGDDQRPDVEMPLEFPEPLMGRYRTLGMNLFELLGIERDDKEKRLAHYLRNFNAFGAPHLVYIAVRDGLTPYAVFDAGAAAYAVTLAAHQRGVGTCELAALVRYPDLVRRHVDFPAGRRLVIGLALGYPDPDHPANAFQPTRESLDEVATFID